MKIVVKCKGADLLPVEVLEAMQGSLKKITDDDLAKLRRNIERDGFIAPVFIWTSPQGKQWIMDGHQRVKALLAMKVDGWVIPDIPVDYIHAKSKKEAERFLLQIVSQFGRVTQKGLDKFILDSNLSTAILAGEISIPSVYLDDSGESPEEADTPTEMPPARVKRGDIWILGKHRLMCGDASDKEDVDALIHKKVMHLLNTDPPYNVKVEPRSGNAMATRKGKGLPLMHHQKFDTKRHKVSKTLKTMRAKDRVLENDFMKPEEYDKILVVWFVNASAVMAPGASFYIWGGYANIFNYPAALKAAEFYFAQTVIWDKEHPVLTRKDFMGAHEWAFYGWKEGGAHRFFGPNNATDLWHIKKVPSQKMVHLTEKPVELAEIAIKYSSKRGENVLDPFGGSGSTLIACENLGRHAFIMEIDPPYCDVIVQRWETATGAKAKKEKKAC